MQDTRAVTGALVVSDVHLSREHGLRTGRALAEVISRHAGHELVLAGDIFDLTLEADRDPGVALGAILGAHCELQAALQTHVRAGGRVVLVPGNHDAALGTRAGLEGLRRSIQAGNESQVEVARWFYRFGAVHIEHGHLYDRDNAFVHPLGPHDPHTEPLGTALMRRFVAPSDAHIFAHAHETTIASGLGTAFRHFGWSAPLVIARYFRTAFSLCLETNTLRGRREEESRQGNALIEERAQELGLPPELLADLAQLRRRPTHDRFSHTWMRLYFDRIAAGVTCAAGTIALTQAGLSAQGAPSGLVAAAGAAYLAQSLSRQKNRYGARVVEEVAESAQAIRAVSQAELVVLGHTHHAAVGPGYVNLGTFGFGRDSRPFLLVGADGTYEHQGVPAV